VLAGSVDRKWMPSTVDEVSELDRWDGWSEPHAMDSDERPVAEVAAALAEEIRGVLGDDLVGLYLYGSSVSGGFDAGVSDIDLVAVTSPEVEALDLAGLDRMQNAFINGHPEWRDRLEVVYVGRATLQSFRSSPGSLAVISPGEPFHVRDEPVADWLQNWYLVRETGLRLYGADAAAIVPVIAWAEFIAATTRYAEEVRDRSRAGSGAGTVAYAILTMCRALRTVRTQTHGSKQEAAAWTRDLMPEWAPLIDAALQCRLSRGRIGFDDERSRAAADRFIARLGDEIRQAATQPGEARPPEQSVAEPAAQSEAEPRT
jgi:predicted nucleotidyltransferase